MTMIKYLKVFLPFLLLNWSACSTYQSSPESLVIKEVIVTPPLPERPPERHNYKEELMHQKLEKDTRKVARKQGEKLGGKYCVCLETMDKNEEVKDNMQLRQLYIQNCEEVTDNDIFLLLEAQQIDKYKPDIQAGYDSIKAKCKKNVTW